MSGKTIDYDKIAKDMRQIAHFIQRLLENSIWIAELKEA